MNKVIVTVTFCLCICFACTDKTDPPDTVEKWSLQKVNQLLDFRWKQGDTLPNFHADLLSIFPEPWTPFTHKESNSKGIYEQAPFWSEARGVYFQTDQGFVEVYLADYSADRQAFLRLFRQYESVRDSENSRTKIWKEDQEGVFAWEWVDTQSQLSCLEAGAYARFHIFLRTNLPEAKQNLAEAWEKLDWNKLRLLAPLP